MSFFSPAPRPLDERERQRAVDALGVLRAPPDPALHAIVAEGAHLFRTPMAALSIVDRDRQWFAARVGLDAPETSRAVSFCAHAILSPRDLLVVEDATQDDRFAGNPLVQFEPGIRFYAGAPITAPNGQPLGTLCVIDTRPRSGDLPLVRLSALADRAARAIADMARHAEAGGPQTAGRY